MKIFNKLKLQTTRLRINAVNNARSILLANQTRLARSCGRIRARYVPDYDS